MMSTQQVCKDCGAALTVTVGRVNYEQVCVDGQMYRKTYRNMMCKPCSKPVQILFQTKKL